MLMEPIALGTAVARYVSKQLASRFGKSVIERWTRHRAERFFDSLVEALGVESSSGTENARIDTLLEEILSDEKKSEALFDAYRRVCFSRSRDLGPRIIGLLTGRLVREGRMADEGEEKVFQAAELLGDGELLSFFKTYSDFVQKAAQEQKSKEHYYEGEDLVAVWNEETRDSSWQHSKESEIEVGSLDLGLALGYWAVKLQSCNLLADRVTHRQQEYKEDSERHIDEGGVLSIYRWSLVFSSSCATLHELVARSLARQNPEGHR